MSAFWGLLRKELRELARPNYLIPLLVMPLFFVLALQGVGATADAASEQPVVAVVDNDGDEYASLATATLEANADVTTHESSLSREQAVERLRDGPADTMFVFPANFSERIRAGQQGEVIVYSSTSQFVSQGGVQSRKATGLLSAVDAELAANVTGATPAELNPTTSSHSTYVSGTQVDATPGALSGAVSLRFFFLGMVMVLAIFGAGTLVVNSMGAEKENGTLETLLTLPVQRRTLVSAKLGASSILGVGLAVFYVAVLYVARPDTGTETLVQLTGADYALVGVSLSLAIVDMLALALCLGIFANDRRSAQSLLMPVGFLAMVPAFVVGFIDVAAFSLPARAAFYAIPSTYPVVAPYELAFRDGSVVLAGIAYQALFAIAAIAVTVKLFGSDRLVTGDAGRLSVVVDALQK